MEKEISLRNAISYCIENNDANTATNRVMEFIRDEKEAINLTDISGSFSASDMENFAAKCMLFGNDGKTTDKLLQEFIDNDLNHD